MTGTTSMGRRTFLAAALASAAAAASGCGFSGDDESATDATDGAGSSGPVPVGGTLRQSMLPVPHLDPVFNGSISARGNLLQAGLMEGLVVRAAGDGSNVLPGVAEDWTISDDGLVYTFTLRSDATWSNGDPVTAEDFAWNWERSLSPATAQLSENAQSANGRMKNVAGAAAFFGGSVTEFSTVGVKAVDEHTLEFTLVGADPDFIHLLAEWRTLPLHPATVQAHPDAWFEPANWVGNGPFVLESWRANASAVLVRNETYWDKDNFSVDRWEVTFNDGGDTAQMVSYQADEIDTFMVEGDPAAILTDPELKEELQTAEPSQYKCLVVMPSQNTVLEDIRIRKALSLAIDREAIATLADPDSPGYSLIPSGVAGYEDVPQTKFDPDEAKSLLADAGYADGEGMPTINFLVFTPTPWVEAIGDMWRQHLGIQAAVDLVEVGVYGKKRAEVQPEDYVGFSYGYFGITPPTLFKALSDLHELGQFAMPVAAATNFQAVKASKDMNPADQAAELDRALREDTFPEFKAYVDLMDQARAAAADPDAMHDILLEAAAAREESYVALPVLWAGYSFMVKPRVHDLTVTSYPDMVFNLSGVTIDS